jgi:hypothetical protein
MAEPLFDCALPRKLLYDIPGAIRLLTRDRLALIADHHIQSYLNLFKQAA